MTSTRRAAKPKASAQAARKPAAKDAGTKSRRITNLRANASVLGTAASMVPGQIVSAPPKK